MTSPVEFGVGGGIGVHAVDGDDLNFGRRYTDLLEIRAHIGLRDTASELQQADALAAGVVCLPMEATC